MDTNISISLPIALALIGAFFFLFALVGGLDLANLNIQTAELWQRLVSGLIGILLVVSAVFLWIKGLGKGKENPVPRQAIPAAEVFFATVTERANDFNSKLKGATEVNILGITAVNLLSRHKKNIDIAMRENNCKFRILFLNPSCEAAKHVYSGNTKLYEGNSNTSTKILTDFFKNHSSTVEIRTMDYAPSVSIISYKYNNSRSAPTNSIQVQMYLQRAATSTDRPIFSVQEGDKWYGVFQTEFDLLWDSAVSWRT